MTEITTRPIALIGGTGKTGRPLIQALRRRGAEVRLLSRNPDAASAPADVEVVGAELGHVGSLAEAFRGAGAIHYIPPSLDNRDPAYVENIIAAAQSAGVSRVVYHSLLHSSTPEMPHHWRKSGCERQFRHSPLEWTVLQPAMYVQTALLYFNSHSGQLNPPFNPLRRFTLAHERDLAEAAAIVHTSPGHVYATYELVGPEDLNFVQMGEILADILGRPVETRGVDPVAYVDAYAVRRQLSPDQARERLAMFQYYDAHGLRGTDTVLRHLIGRAPTSFADAARETLGERL